MGNQGNGYPPTGNQGMGAANYNQGMGDPQGAGNQPTAGQPYGNNQGMGGGLTPLVNQPTGGQSYGNPPMGNPPTSYPPTGNQSYGAPNSGSQWGVAPEPITPSTITPAAGAPATGSQWGGANQNNYNPNTGDPLDSANQYTGSPTLGVQGMGGAANSIDDQD
jgi:hypothetical protein